MKNAYDYGFKPDGDARANTIALQNAVIGGGIIEIVKPGIYDVDQTIILESYTTLRFGKGVYLRRQQAKDSAYGYTFINNGAYTKQFDTDITIEGLHLICNEVDTVGGTIPGLRGYLSFFYAKNIIIRDFTCLDLLTYGFGIHICTFDNVIVENVHIEGKKDGVHFGRGKNFVVRHGKFKTFDDPIALNAHDYSSSNPQLGWIENGLIEDCYDLDDDTTTGYFCRILAGAWCDWYEGMEVQNSDTVVNHGRLYRVMAKPDGKIYKSITPPLHENGTDTLDGISWVMIQDDVIYNCGCRNIVFKDIHLCKKRDTALSIHFDNDRYSRSVYPNSEMPVQENIVFESLYVENKIDVILSSISPVKEVIIRNSRLPQAKFVFSTLPIKELFYPEATIYFENVEFDDREKIQIQAADNRKVCITEY